MTDILIRDIPKAAAARLDEMARQQGISRVELIRSTLIELAGDTGIDPGLVLGFVELHESELGPEWICSGCNQELLDKKLFLGYTGDLRPFGPVCQGCATTE